MVYDHLYTFTVLQREGNGKPTEWVGGGAQFRPTGVNQYFFAPVARPEAGVSWLDCAGPQRPGQIG